MLLSSSNRGSNLKNITDDRCVYRDSNTQIKMSVFILCAKPIMKCNVAFIVRSELCGFTLLEVPQFSG